MRPEGLRQKKIPNDTIWNWTRDLLAFTAIPQPTAPQCDPNSLLYSIQFHHVRLLGNLGVFTELQKVTVSYVMSICPCVCSCKWTTWLPVEIWHLSIFRKYIENFPFSFKSDKSKGTLHEEQFTFIISRRNFLKFDICGENCRENERKHVMFNIIFPKIVSFRRYCGKTR